MNPASIFKIKKAWETFAANHPKFPAFLSAAGNGMIKEGSVIEIHITDAEGKSIATNVKLTQSDMDLFENLKGMM